ncbi:hypothetical protein AB1Y20_003867 [Prymnesium parvum]|uniref:Uncharacterized protein n=1 Tax=Prymnesium parvum TaxID=97485 RepID=A0AB34J6E4_PRYPA
MSALRREEERSTENPDEPIISLKRGPHSEPWHPRTMAAPLVYKVAIIGARQTGKSCIANRLVSRTFDAQYRPTRMISQLFWRHFDESIGSDVLVELEDTPAIDIGSGSTATPKQLKNVEQLLKPLMWFEKFRKERDVKKAVGVSETDALLEDGSPRVAAAANKKRGKNGPAGIAGKACTLGSRLGGSKSSGITADGKMNPIAADRKRMGFVIVADVTDFTTFDVAYALVDRIFDRLQFDVGDSIICPVSIVIVGNKADMRSKRQVPDEKELQDQIHAQYSNKNNDPSNNVIYVECSAQTNYQVEEIFKASLRRIRQLPARSRIRTARMRVTGLCGRIKRNLYGYCPFMFDVEDFIKQRIKKYVKPCIRRMGLYAILCECAPLVIIVKRIKQLWRVFLTFRWLCNWCPSFILRLRKEVTADEQDKAVEDLERALEGGAKKKEDEDEDD